MRLLLLFYMCFGFGEKFPTPSATTSDSRNFLQPGVPPPARGPTAELWETRARRERPDRPAPRAHAAHTRRAHGAPRHVSRRAARASSGAQNGALPAR